MTPEDRQLHALVRRCSRLAHSQTHQSACRALTFFIQETGSASLSGAAKFPTNLPLIGHWITIRRQDWYASGFLHKYYPNERGETLCQQAHIAFLNIVSYYVADVWSRQEKAHIVPVSRSLADINAENAFSELSQARLELR